MRYHWLMSTARTATTTALLFLAMSLPPFALSAIAVSTAPASDLASVPLVEGWPPLTRNAARALIEKYGPPDETSPDRLTWSRRTPWARVVVYRDGPEDEFPFPHHDFVENTVTYAVPPAKATTLLKFNGSLLIDVAHVTLTSRSDSEEGNVLALNLADELVNGRRTTGSARSAMRRTMEMLAAGRSSPYTDGLLFVPLDVSPKGR